jgi:outer membrane receptor protein involved in Fe transport
VGAWRTFNPQPFTGSYDIKEGYLELGVPLLRNVAFARSLDLNGAVRHAIYSQSGGVTTWKLGGVWDVNGAVRLRGTLSQDIRGPNLLELFNPGGQTLNNLTYLGRSVQSQNITSGNANLRPKWRAPSPAALCSSPISCPASRCRSTITASISRMRSAR